MIFVIRFMTGVLAAFSAFAGCFLIQHPLKHFSLGASLFAFGISAAFLFFAFRLHGAAKPGKKYFPIWAVLF
ncbi:MAG: hypothetical protein ACREL1_02770, partial [bacterium]